MGKKWHPTACRQQWPGWDWSADVILISDALRERWLSPLRHVRPTREGIRGQPVPARRGGVPNGAGSCDCAAGSGTCHVGGGEPAAWRRPAPAKPDFERFPGRGQPAAVRREGQRIDRALLAEQQERRSIAGRPRDADGTVLNPVATSEPLASIAIAHPGGLPGAA